MRLQRRLIVRSGRADLRWLSIATRAKLHGMSSANASEIEHWNGDEARHWVEEQDRYDRQLAPFADALLRAAAIGASDRVLDLGCGCGTTTLLAARDGAEAVGVDISAPMLEHARAAARAANVANVRFEQADVQTHAFVPASFDVAISRFGVMFFDDPGRRVYQCRPCTSARRPARVCLLAGPRPQRMVARSGDGGRAIRPSSRHG
jgi:SAM-dependent methyltransferase